MIKEKVVNVRMSEELYKILKIKAETSGLKQSEFIRQSIHDTKVQFNNNKDITQLIGTLNKIGNNLNQISRVLNIAKKNNNLSDVDYNLLKNELYIIRQSFRELIKC